MNKKANILFSELGKWVAIAITLAVIIYFIYTLSGEFFNLIEVTFG